MLKHARPYQTPVLLLKTFQSLRHSLPPRFSSSKHPVPDNPRPAHGSFPLRTADITAQLKDIGQQVGRLTSLDENPLSRSQTDRYNAIVSRLRQALAEEELGRIWKEWSALQEENLLRFLALPQLSECSRVVAALCPTDVANNIWGDQDMRVAEEIALVAAASDHTEAFSSCMLLHLQQRKPDAVIGLYNRYRRLLPANDVEAAEAKAADEDKDNDDNATAPSYLLSIMPDTNPVAVSRVKIALPVIAAYAMKGSFIQAYEVTKDVSVRRHSYTTQTFLEQLKPEPSYRAEIERYFRQHALASLISRPVSLVKQITNYVKSRSPDYLETLYKDVLDGIQGEHAYLAPSTKAVSAQRPFEVPYIFWSMCLSGFIACNRMAQAEKLWDDIVKAGIPVLIPLWTALFEGYDALKGRSADARNAWHTMISEKVKPDGYTYRAYISVLSQGRHFEEALKVFGQFKRDRARRPKDIDEVQTRAVYNTVIFSALHTPKGLKTAEDVLRSMREDGPKPDIFTYNTFLGAHARNSNFQGISQMLQDLRADGLQGDVATFSTILIALLKAGRPDAEHIVSSIMEKQGIEPNVHTYNAIIENLMKERNSRSLQLVFDILRKMEAKPTTAPNAMTYTSILGGVYRGDWVDQDVAKECIDYVWQMMKQRNVVLPRLTAHMLLQACLRNSRPEGLSYALAVYRELERTWGPTNDTWYILLSGLMERGDWHVAEEVMGEMLRSNHQPGAPVRTLVKRIKARMSLGSPMDRVFRSR